MSSSELESRRDEEDKNDWMESYLKSRGLRDLVVVPCSSEASLGKESTEEQDFAEDKELQEYIKRETVKMELKNEAVEFIIDPGDSDIPPTEILQKKMLDRVVISNRSRRRKIPEVHYHDTPVTNIEEPKHVSRKSILGRMLEHNKQVKIDKIKAGFSPRKGVYHVKKRNKPRWSRFVKYH
jgi:hypothetical protein